MLQDDQTTGLLIYDLQESLEPLCLLSSRVDVLSLQLSDIFSLKLKDLFTNAYHLKPFFLYLLQAGSI